MAKFTLSQLDAKPTDYTILDTDLILLSIGTNTPFLSSIKISTKQFADYLAADTSGWTDDGTNVTLATSTDNVGIGTSDPSTKLQITADDGTAIIRLERADTTIVDNDVYGEIQWEGTDADNAGSDVRSKITVEGEGDAGQSAMLFYTAGAGNTVTEKMRINTDGKVGLGTDSPAEQLTLTGNMSANGHVYMGSRLAPGTPAGGGVLYVEAGALKYKGSNGTVTTLGNA